VPTGEIVFDSNRIYAEIAVCPSPSLRRCRGRTGIVSAAGFYARPRFTGFAPIRAGRSTTSSTARPLPRSAIDTLTGESRVLRAELVQDCGRSLNPAIDLGQIEGAFVQGMGWLTSEELWWTAKAACGRTAHRPTKFPAAATCADFQYAAAQRCAEPRGHDLPLQGDRRAAADAGDLRVARHGTPSRASPTIGWRLVSTRRPRRSECWPRSRICGRARSASRQKPTRSVAAGRFLHPPHSALYTLLRRVIAVSPALFYHAADHFGFERFETYASGLRALERVNLDIRRGRFLRCWARTAPARRR